MEGKRGPDLVKDVHLVRLLLPEHSGELVCLKPRALPPLAFEAVLPVVFDDGVTVPLVLLGLMCQWLLQMTHHALLPVISHKFISLNNIPNTLRYVHATTHLLTETTP